MDTSPDGDVDASAQAGVDNTSGSSSGSSGSSGSSSGGSSSSSSGSNSGSSSSSSSGSGSSSANGSSNNSAAPDTGSTSLSRPAEVSAVSIKLPPFWPTDPNLWFAQVEAQFATRGISAELTKLNYVISSLSQEYAHEVRDILLRPPTVEPYTHLRAQLIARLSASAQKRIRQLLTDEQLGDRKPTQLLRSMQRLQSDTPLDSDLLRELFLQRLPSNVRMVLASARDLPLEQQAKLADNIIEMATQPPIAAVPTGYQSMPATCAVQPAGHSTTVQSQDIQSTIATLVSQVSELNAAVSQLSRSRSNSLSEPRSRAQSFSRRESGLCWYHARFGAKATKCTSPCTYASGNGSASH